MFRGLSKFLCASMVLSLLSPAMVMAEEAPDVFEEEFEAEGFAETEEVFEDDDFSDVEDSDLIEFDEDELIESEDEIYELLDGEQLFYEETIQIKDGKAYWKTIENVKGGIYCFESFSKLDTFISITDAGDDGELDSDDDEFFSADDKSDSDYNFKLVMTLKEGHTYRIRVSLVDSYDLGEIPFRITRQTGATISYDANGGTGAPADQEVSGSDTEISLSTKKPKKYMNITYDGNGGKADQEYAEAEMAFTEWNTKADGTGEGYAAGAPITVDADVTLYAQYGSSGVLGTLATPVRPGYIFDGWYTEKSDGTKVTSGMVFEEAQTIYAHWSKDETDYGDTAEGFVYRLYRNILNRDADREGMNYWVNELKSGKKNGVQVADKFIHSTEFLKRNLSDTAYIEILYTTFLNRSSDRAGIEYWSGKLNKGLSRDYIYAGFINSPEFQKICEKYGIKSGKVTLTEARDQNQGVTTFICRCYDVFLGRKADVDGLNYWCAQLLDGKKNAKEVAKGFVLSKEFTAKNLSDEAYLRTLYKGIFNREAESSGLEYWGNKLWAGLDRKYVCYGFADSKEYRNLAASFGLDSSWPASICDKIFDGGSFTLIIPASWQNQYEVQINGNTFSFYEKSNNAYGRSNRGTNTFGHLFTVRYSLSLLNIESRYDYLGNPNGYYWYIIYPSDVQYDSSNAARTKNYKSMEADVAGVVSTLQLKKTK